jgi:outer membrane receptor protein involved in Fe transport
MANDFVVGNPQPYGGSYNVREAFGEISAPLLEGLNVDLAGRLTQYSTSGQVETWKAGVTYNLPSFLSDFKLRATRSRDIRAASLTELYTGYAQARTTVVDPFATGNNQLSVSQYTGGNAALKPEKADTISAGVVFEPSFIPGLSASVDYYNIKIKNLISTLTSQDILNFCFQGQTALCNQVKRDGNGNLTAVYATNINIASQTTSGFDMELNYQRDIPDVFSDRDATLGVRLFANYVDRFLVFNGKTTSNQDSCLSCQDPKWEVQALYTYATGPYRATVVNRLIGGGQYNNIYDPQDPSYVPNAIQNNHVNPILYTDLNLALDFTKWGMDSEAFLNIDNIFDRDPPFAFGLKYGPNANPLYDVVGRMYKVGVRFKT